MVKLLYIFLLDKYYYCPIILVRQWEAGPSGAPKFALRKAKKFLFFQSQFGILSRYVQADIYGKKEMSITTGNNYTHFPTIIEVPGVVPRLQELLLNLFK